MHAPTTDIKNAISHHKNIRLGFDSPSRLFFSLYCVSDSACSNACLRLSTRANVGSGNVTLHSARLWKVGWSDNHHQRRVRKGVCTYVAIAFLNAAMIFFSPSNVSSADCPPRQRLRIARRGSGYAGNSMDCSTASYILRFSASPSARVTNCTT